MKHVDASVEPELAVRRFVSLVNPVSIHLVGDRARRLLTAGLCDGI